MHGNVIDWPWFFRVFFGVFASASSALSSSLSASRLQPCAYHVGHMPYTVCFCSALLFFPRQCFAVWFQENWRVVWGLLAFSMSCARTGAHAYSPEIRLCAPKHTHTHNKSCYFRSVGPVSEESAVTFLLAKCQLRDTERVCCICAVPT